MGKHKIMHIIVGVPYIVYFLFSFQIDAKVSLLVSI